MWSTAITRSPSPSNARPKSALCKRTASLTTSGCVAPHASLMFFPFGRSFNTMTVAPSRANTSGATSLIAPLAQSNTTRMLAKAKTGNSPTMWDAYSPIKSTCVAEAEGTAAEPVMCDSIASCCASLNFTPPLANSFTPLSKYGLCDAVIAALAQPRFAARNAIAGVGTTPSSSTDTPPASNPLASAVSICFPDSRVSRPIRTLVTPSSRAATNPSSATYCSVSSVKATPRTPSVPNRSIVYTHIRAKNIARTNE